MLYKVGKENCSVIGKLKPLLIVIIGVFILPNYINAQPTKQITQEKEVGGIHHFNNKLHIGIKSGLTVAAYRGTEVESAYAQFGASADLHLRYEFTPYYSLNLEIGYSYRPAIATYTEYFRADTFPDGSDVGEEYQGKIVNDTRLTFDYLNFPLVSRFNLIQEKGYNSFLDLGAWAGVILDSKLEGDYEVRISELSTLEDMTMIVEEGKVDENQLDFRQFDFGLIIGGGSSFSVGKGNLITNLRFNVGLPDLETSTLEFRSGGFSWMIGYEI